MEISAAFEETIARTGILCRNCSAGIANVSKTFGVAPSQLEGHAVAVIARLKNSMATVSSSMTSMTVCSFVICSMS